MLSKEKREEQRFRMFVQHNKKFIQATLDHPEFMKKCKEIINLKDEKEAS